MVTFAQLRDAKLDDLDAAWRSWRKLVEYLEQAEDHYQGKFLQGVRAARWQGQDAEAAMRTLLPAQTRIRVAAGEAAAIASVLNTALRRFKKSQDELKSEINEAQFQYMKVGHDGSIIFPQALPPKYVNWDQFKREATRIQGEFQRILKEATAADNEIATALHGAAVLDSANPLAGLRGDAGLAAKLAGFDPNQVPPKNLKNPKEVAAWWKNLPEEQRHLMMNAYPEKIGWLDGIPSEDRNEANRTRLQTRLAELQGKNGHLTAFEQRDLGRLVKLQNAMSAYEAKGQDLYLLGFDSTTASKVENRDYGADGRAIVAFGNPDAAKHTAVYVPGTTEQLESFPGSMQRAFNLGQAARIYSDGPVSSIAWLGYDAPDDVVGNAPFGHYADSGAPKFNGFIDGLRETQAGAGNPGSHVTAVGHSYGSLVIGEAARHHDDRLKVDDIMVAGSPGMHVKNAGELGIGANHVYSQEAHGDPVPNMGRYVHGGVGWGFDQPKVPSDGSFGGHRLTTDGSGHSDYWNDLNPANRKDSDPYSFGHASKSLDQQARVVAGTYGDDIPRNDPIPYGKGGPGERKDSWWQIHF